MKLVNVAPHFESAGEEGVPRGGAFDASQGIAGWVVRLLHRWRDDAQGKQRQMRVIETLTLGGKRQLTLVACGTEQFLVGCGLDSVDAIVPLRGEYVSVPDRTRTDVSCG